MKLKTKSLTFLVVLLFLSVQIQTVYASSTFTDSFSDDSHISSLSQLVVFGGQVELDQHNIYSEGWWNNSFTACRKLTTDSGDVDEVLTDFPTLVYLNSSRIDWSNVQDDLDDLRFIDSTNSTEYAYEIDNYVVNDEAWVWVKIPSVSNIADTDVFMYYGYSSAESGEDPEAVWDTNYVLVTHMNDDPDTSHIRDSTSNNNDGAKAGSGTPPETTNGKIGNAQDPDGSATHRIELPDNAFSALASATIEAWIRADSDITSDFCFFSVKQGTDTNYSFYIYLQGATDKVRVWFNPPNKDILSNLALLVGNWYHVMVIVGDAGGMEMYINGVKQTDTDIDTTCFNDMPTTQKNHLCIAWYNNFFISGFKGVNDEIRVSEGRRSGAWILASYESQRDNFLSFGAEEQVGVIYYDDGYLYSTNLLTGLNITEIISFGYNCSIEGSETIKFQFSQDNATWYNGTEVSQWYNALDGVNNLNLKTLGWNGGLFYYRVNMTAGTTPELYSINVSYSTSGIASVSYTSFVFIIAIVGLIFGVLALDKRR